MENARYLKVEAGVRYWDDAFINGEQDESGDSVPFKKGDTWNPVIDLDSGIVIDWPNGVTADIHFKVCDAGVYFLLDSEKNLIAQRLANYVPDGLCYGGNGYGDYIILKVDGTGKIDGYSNKIDDDEWEKVSK